MEQIVEFLKKHKRKSSFNYTFNELFGKDAYAEFDNLEEKYNLLEESKILDKTSKNKSTTEKKLKNLISRLYNTCKKNISIEKRSVIYTGHNHPLKIDLLIKKKVKKTCYIKPQVNVRAISLEFYNMLSGNKTLDYMVDNDIIIQKEQPGELLINANKTFKLKNNETYLENLIRLNTFAQLVSLSDLTNPYNTNIDKEYNIHPVDFESSFNQSHFNCLYNKNMNIYNLPLKEIIHDEAKNIISRINNHKDRYNDLLNVLKKSNYIKFNFECDNNTNNCPSKQIEYIVKEYKKM